MRLTIFHPSSPMRARFITALLLILFPTFIGCKKWVEVPAPATSITANNVYTNDQTATAALTGIYAEMSNQDATQGQSNITDLSVICGLSADELTLYDVNNLTYNLFYTNELGSMTSGGAFWASIYTLLYQVNAGIQGLNTSTTLTPVVKQQLLGESYFLRGFYYFYLTQLYGDVPLVLTTDYKTNESIGRSPRVQIYTQVVTDLKLAKSLLSGNYLDPTLINTTNERVRPTKWAAGALLARTYLYSIDYKNAELEADTVIANSELFNLDNLENVFLNTSKEAIWQLQPVNTGTQSNTGEGLLFVLPSTGPDALGTYPVYLDSSLVAKFSTSDNRRKVWIDSVIANGTTYYFPFKYKLGATATTTQEYVMMLRLGELYLIRAEARAQLNEISGSQSDIDMIRTRAGLADVTADDATSLMSEIVQERQYELFSEWGNRWFDMQRLSLIDSIMNIASPVKGGTWVSYKALFPVPQSEIFLDAKLTQNIGY
jgi:starch-binding outer membrane protein, SusD/RagB family